MGGPGESRSSFRLARFGGREEIAIPARRAGGQLLALAVCVVAWPIAVFLKVGFIAAGKTSALLILPAAALVLVLVFVLLQIGWWLAGIEWIGAVGGDLRIRHTILGIPFSSHFYRGAEIRFLAPVDLRPKSGWLKEPSLPFLGATGHGAVKFFHRGSTIYIGHDLDTADAGAVVAWLAFRLPNGVVDAER